MVTVTEATSMDGERYYSIDPPDSNKASSFKLIIGLKGCIGEGRAKDTTVVRPESVDPGSMENSDRVDS